MNALTNALIQKGIISLEDFQKSLYVEAGELDKAYERKFPGFQTSELGIEMDVARCAETMKGWRP